MIDLRERGLQLLQVERHLTGERNGHGNDRDARQTGWPHQHPQLSERQGNLVKGVPRRMQIGSQVLQINRN